MEIDRTALRARLDAASAGLEGALRGATARADEHNCECHWGSAEELALLKVPGVELDADLLRRTWEATDWDDHPAVLRRILPQFAAALVTGTVDPVTDAGRAIRRGRWQEWPVPQAAAVREFLDAWWADVLGDPAPAVPAHEVLAVCAGASGSLRPWLEGWEAQTNAVAARHRVVAAEQWREDLTEGQLPWSAWYGDDEEALGAELWAWLSVEPGGVGDEESTVGVVDLDAAVDLARLLRDREPAERGVADPDQRRT